MLYVRTLPGAIGVDRPERVLSFRENPATGKREAPGDHPGPRPDV
jgi:hypothetical protein